MSYINVTFLYLRIYCNGDRIIGLQIAESTGLCSLNDNGAQHNQLGLETQHKQ